MTEEGGSGTRLVCPACGRAREAGGRYCPGCGLDYWRLAAGGTVESAGGPVRKGRFGRGRKAPAPPPAPPAATPGPTPVVTPRASRWGSAAQPPASATEAAGSHALSDRVRQVATSVRMPQSPRSRLMLGGLVAAIALLIIAALVMRPGSPAATGPTPKPSPSAPAPDDVIAAFFKSARDPNATFEVTMNGTFTQTARGKRSNGSIAADLRFVGDSLSGRLRLAQPGVAGFNGSMVRIGQQSWTRVSGGAWRQQALPAAADAINPLSWIATVDDLSYVRAGPGQAGARTHILQSTKWLSGTQYDDIVAGLRDAQRDSRMEVETTEAGVPLHATYQFTIRGTLSATAGTLVLSGSTEFTFSHWGEAFTIGPPT
jgi:hypothetical protein